MTNPTPTDRSVGVLPPDDDPIEVTEDNLTLNSLSQYVFTAVGEASTLFSYNDQVFDAEAARKLAERLIVGVNNLLAAARREAVEGFASSLRDKAHPITVDRDNLATYSLYQISLVDLDNAEADFLAEGRGK